MNEISDNAIMAALGRQMTLAVARQVVAAGNLANIDTPGYRARQVDFGDLLAGEIEKLGLSGAGGQEIEGTAAREPATSEVGDLPSRRDGNNVQLDRELMTMAQANADFAAAQAVVTAKFRLIRYAINEGR